MKSMKKSNGFTLVELIVVISILGILLSIAVLNFSGIIGNANEDADQASARSILTAIQVTETNATGGLITEADVNAHLDIEVKLVTMDTVPASGWSIAKEDDNWNIFKNSILVYP